MGRGGSAFGSESDTDECLCASVFVCEKERETSSRNNSIVTICRPFYAVMLFFQEPKERRGILHFSSELETCIHCIQRIA